ncbi:MAG: sigma 54-dependent Fis family transcriptional regulator [Deltaproteobacteria bacterium]|nr:sigma 54-dependent Fis family transcriptional regulator [Deltaproteobacteria bacterium]
MAPGRDHGFDDVETATLDAVPEPPERATLQFVVEVIEGADAGARAVVVADRPSALLVGQATTCDLRLDDRQVSRRHLSLDVEGTTLRLRDLGSTNGTFIGALRVHDATLSGGEVVRVGGSSLRVSLVADANVAAPPHATSSATSFGKLIGGSHEMRRLYPLCERLAHVDVPVVIEGETGTGKEVLAESLHESGARRSGPFVVFDCTAVPGTLLESALFGHERGAFTGATETRVGVFEEADGGTLLIDEIGDLDIALQAKLLRVLERSEVKRVGGSKWIRADVRVLAATRRDLDKAVQEGRFRDDLYFRLAVARIELPPLRRRQGDVRSLAQHFWSRLAPNAEPMSEDLLTRLESHSWPGNVRELYHTIARYAALGELAPVSGAPGRGGEAPSDPFEKVLALDLPLTAARQRVVEAFERKYVERVLAKHGGNVARAAESSGLARRYFQLLRARQREGG